MKELRRHLRKQEIGSIWAERVDKNLETLQTYIGRNRSSVVNYAARCCSSARISTSSAESSVNRLVAKRFVKKQQMRWSRVGGYYLLKTRVAVLNGDLSERTRYDLPKHAVKGNPAAFTSPKLPIFKAAMAA